MWFCCCLIYHTLRNTLNLTCFLRFGLLLWSLIRRALDSQPRSQGASPAKCPGNEATARLTQRVPWGLFVERRNFLETTFYLWGFICLREKSSMQLWTIFLLEYIGSNWRSYRQSPMSAKARAERRMLFFSGEYIFHYTWDVNFPFYQEPMIRSMQFQYIPVTAFPQTNLFWGRISWNQALVGVPWPIKRN